MNRLTFRFLFLIISLLCSSALYAGTWMRSEKDGRYSGGLTYDSATSYWDNTLHRISLPCETQNWALSQSYEYGWSYYRTLFGSVDLRDRNCGAPISSAPSSKPYSHTSGVADVQLGMRGRLNIYRNGRTWEMSVILPTGYPSNVPSRLGNGLYGFKVGAYGRFFNQDLDEEYPVTPTLELGSDVTIWQGVASDQLHAYTKVTMPVFKVFSLYGMGSADVALTNRSATYNPNTNAYRTYGYDKLTGRVGIATKLTKTLHISFETSNVLWGRNTNDTTTYSLTITRNFKD